MVVAVTVVSGIVKHIHSRIHLDVSIPSTTLYHLQLQRQTRYPYTGDVFSFHVPASIHILCL